MRSWFSIEKQKDNYNVCKNAECKCGIGRKGLFSGTKKECEDFCKKNKIKIGKRGVK